MTEHFGAARQMDLQAGTGEFCVARLNWHR